MHVAWFRPVNKKQVYTHNNKNNDYNKGFTGLKYSHQHLIVWF